MIKHTELALSDCPDCGHALPWHSTTHGGKPRCFGNPDGSCACPNQPWQHPHPGVLYDERFLYHVADPPRDPHAFIYFPDPDYCPDCGFTTAYWHHWKCRMPRPGDIHPEEDLIPV
jgi:predicted RNA-binding Zn-ribbon protein involved in translation (DUF1610 family)